MTQAISTEAALAAIVGDSPAIAALREQIRHLVSFDTVGNPHVPTTLLVGETGTGKGLVARAIHDCGPRARGALIDVNCAAIPENLLEAELFGFEAGAFTDAKRAKPGLFEAAARGTLFLDEVDALPLPLQAKFLKAVEEKRVRRLGAVSEREVDVKIIAATQKDLAASVNQGRFRLDLYHRLASLVLAIPPLRERGDDVLVLAAHFLTRYAAAHEVAAVELTESARAWLRSHPWPGNVRELSHLLERVALLKKDRALDAQLLEQLRLPGPLPISPPNRLPPESDDSFEAARIRSALTTTGGNVVGAARILGLTRNALRYRMRRYGVDRPTLDGRAITERRAARAPSNGADRPGAAAPVSDPEPRKAAYAEPSASVVGREKERTQLAEALEFVAHGSARALIASGAAGIGKTRLLRVLRAPAERGGFLWLEGCYEKVGSHPYQAWVQIVRQSLDHPEAAALVRSLRPRLQGIARLMPQLESETGQTTRSQADPESERLRLFESFTEYFVRLSRRIPLVLFLDDLQWAPSLDLLHYLVRNIAKERVLLLATCRSDELKLDNELWRTLVAVQREPNCQVLRLEPFSAGTVGEFLGAQLGGAVAPSLTHAIAAKSGGNPFFTEEILRLLKDQDALVRTESGWELTPAHRLHVPDSVQMVIGERIERLGDPARDILTLAAVIGREFSQRLLQSVAARDEATVVGVLDRSEAAGIVAPAPAPAGDGYHFSHDLIQETLYESLGAAHRRRCHLRIAQALESIDPRQSEALAHHYRAGADAAKALAYSISAGESAESSFSWARAETHYESALALMAGQSGDMAAKARLHEKLADLASLLGHANLEHSRKALEIYTTLDDVSKACRLERLIGVAWTSGTAGAVDLEKALGHFEKAAALAERQADDVEKSLAHGYLAFGLLRARLDLFRAMQEADKALAIASRSADADVQARIHTELGVAHAYSGDLAGAEEHAELSYQLARRAKDPWIGARAALYPIAFWPWRNERHWLELWTRRCLDHRETVLVTRYDLPNFALQALLLALTGRPAEARQALHRAQEAMAQRAFFTPYWLHFSAAPSAILDDERQAVALFEEARRASLAGSLVSNVPEVVLYARFLIARGDTAPAEDILDQGYGVAKRHESIVQQLNLLPLLAEVNVCKGNLQRAGDYLGAAEQLQQRLSGWRGLAAPLCTAAGVLAVARSEWAAAEQSFGTALNLERQHGFFYNEAGILLKWAGLYQRRRRANDDAKALALRNEALAIFECCGAAADAERTRKLL